MTITMHSTTRPVDVKPTSCTGLPQCSHVLHWPSDLAERQANDESAWRRETSPGAAIQEQGLTDDECAAIDEHIANVVFNHAVEQIAAVRDVDVIPDAWRTTPESIARRLAKRTVHTATPAIVGRPATVGNGVVLYHLTHTSGACMRGLPGTDGYSLAAATGILDRMPVENRRMWTMTPV